MPEHIHYDTVSALDNLKCHALETQVKGVLRSHAVRGFRIIVIDVYIQFKALKDRNNCDAPCNVVPREDHVLKIELWHMLIKERCR